MKLANLKEQFYNPNRLQKDGEDHILISLKGATMPGRILTPQYSSKINTSIGDFDSARSFWLWILYKGDDRFRLLQERVILTTIKNEGLTPSFVKNFKSTILYVKYIQLVKSLNPASKEAIMKMDNKPLKMYTEDHKTSFRSANPIEEWWVEGMTEITKAIKEGISVQWENIGDKIPMNEEVFVKSVMETLKAK